MAIQRVIVKRDPDKRAGNQGNPRGTLLLRGNIDGVEMWATTDYVFMPKQEFLKQEERGLKQSFRKNFIAKEDQFVVEYNDDLKEPMDRQKFNFVNIMAKLPDVRLIDEEPRHNKFWTIEFQGEVAIRKAKSLRDIGTVFNMVNLMSYIQRKNICFYYAPHLQPHKLKNSQLYKILLDITTDKDTGQPKGILINSPKRIKSVINDYYASKKDNSFRTDIYKAIAYGIISETPGKGFYVDKQFIGIDAESVYSYLKTDLKMYENYILPQLATRDITNDEDDDFPNVEKAKHEAIDFTDYTSYDLEQLRELAVSMGITRGRTMHKQRLLEEIANVVDANKAKNELAAKTPVEEMSV